MKQPTMPILALVALVATGASSGCEAHAQADRPAASPGQPAQAAVARTPTRAGLALGMSMPAADVSMLAVDGTSITLAQNMGSVGTLVVFTCNHCPWAQTWEQRLVQLGHEFAAKGIGVVAINPNDPAAYSQALYEKMARMAKESRVEVAYSPDSYEEMQRRAQAAGMKFPYVVDGDSNVARSFGATRTPEAYLFGASGKLVYHGTIDDNAFAPEKVTRHFLREALEDLVAHRELRQAESKAPGCGIAFRHADQT